MTVKSKNFILMAMPLIFAFTVGIYSGHKQFLSELSDGNDSSEALQWALIGGLLFSPIGLIIELVLDVLIYLIATEPKRLRE